jgi:signal transduction histidine kinase
MIIAGRNRGRIHAASATLESAALGTERTVRARVADHPSRQHIPAVLDRFRNALRDGRATATPRAARRGFNRQTIVLIPLLALAASAFLPWTRFELHATSDQVAIETTTTLIAAIAAIIFFDRFWRHLRLRDLSLAGGLAVIAVSNLGAGVLLASNLILAGHSAAWVVLGGRLAGWVLIAGSAIVPDRRLRRPARSEIRSALLLAGAIVASATLIVVLNARATSYGALHGGPLGNPTAMLVVQILLVLLTGLAAIAFRHEARGQDSPTSCLLALACTFAAFSALAACATPSFYASRVGVADILRLGWLAALFACACVEWSLDERRAPAHALVHERHRMAADVHDLIMQDLSFALANARTLVDDPTRAHQASTVVAAGERALAGARGVVSGLNAHSSQPIAEAVEASVRAAARHTPLTFHAGGTQASGQPDEPTRNALIHIAREAVTNAVKHARPSTIEVVFGREDEWLLRVRDDGRGFDAADEHDGFGLTSMRHTAEALSGALRVRSSSDDGTTIEVSLP